MKNHGFSRFPKRSWEIWVSKLTTPPRCVQAYAGPRRGSGPMHAQAKPRPVLLRILRRTRVLRCPSQVRSHRFSTSTQDTKGPIALRFSQHPNRPKVIDVPQTHTNRLHSSSSISHLPCTFPAVRSRSPTGAPGAERFGTDLRVL